MALSINNLVRRNANGSASRDSRKNKIRNAERRAGLGFVSPALLLMGILVAYPLFYGLYISFFRTNLVNRWDFVGVDNYKRALSSDSFTGSIWTTLIYALVVVAGTHVLGMLLALALNRRGLIISIFRVI